MVRGKVSKRQCKGLETPHIARQRPNTLKSAIQSADGDVIQRSILLKPEPAGRPTVPAFDLHRTAVGSRSSDDLPGVTYRRGRARDANRGRLSHPYLTDTPESYRCNINRLGRYPPQQFEPDSSEYDAYQGVLSTIEANSCDSARWSRYCSVDRATSKRSLSSVIVHSRGVS